MSECRVRVENLLCKGCGFLNKELNILDLFVYENFDSNDWAAIECRCNNCNRVINIAKEDIDFGK